MTDSSDCESDAGASPSVSSDESGTSSSRCSSPALRIVTDVQRMTTPSKKSSIVTAAEEGGFNSSTIATPVNSSFLSISESCSTPLSSGRRPVRRRQICTPVTPIASASSILRPTTSKGAQSDTNNRTPVSSTTLITPTNAQRKRKLPPSVVFSSPEHSDHHGEDPKSGSPEKKRKRNKRRRTRSERNILAGKTVTVPVDTPVVAEGEEAVALDAEIDKVLEEKAIKNNLSATNVKSIIRHVITNNMVQKMIMSAMRKKAQAEGGDAGGSSDDDGLLEPKMTRAKTKELMGNKEISLWPIVDSPVKISKQLVSETHMLIHNDLPEDSSGDEEYIPKNTAHSDDESSVTSSHTSDVGSPAVPQKPGVTTRRSMHADRSPFTDSMFKTPPPRPNTKLLKQRPLDSAISLRTRSKLPLNDTPLEHLERQLVPPDITKDMYDWGNETDNEDYLEFLNDFLNPGLNQNDGNELDDDAADPEYNVMEDDEDVHDREELRMDRAVKVPKKELTELIAELFEPGGMLSGDDMDDHDLATLTGITPLINDSGYTDSGGRFADTSLNSTAQEFQNSTVDTSAIGIPTACNQSIQAQPSQRSGPNVGPQAVVDSSTNEQNSNEANATIQSDSPEKSPSLQVSSKTEEVYHPPPYFRECDLTFLQHQIRQHVQLLTQSYVLTVTNEDACLKNIAKSSKTMVIELQNLSRMNGPASNFSVCNLESAYTIVNNWPHQFLNKSPIKKKILEAKYISENGFTTNEEGKPKGNYFPRHVVKVIAENKAFLYNSLLPECYNQKTPFSRWRFCYHEDALLVEAIDALKSLKLSALQLAEVISEVLLVVYPPKQLYHRIRNLRKPSSSIKCHPDIKRYFTEGVLPSVERNVPELKPEDLQQPIQRDRRSMSKLWTALLVHIEDSPRERWEEKLKKDPVTKCYDRRWSRAQYPKKDAVGPASSSSTIFTRSETINRVFPRGSLIVEKQNPLVKSIPIMDANGRVGAFIKIPRIALINPSTPQEPKEGDEAGKRVMKMIQSRQQAQAQQPREAQEAGGFVELSSYQQSASNINVRRFFRVFKTPIKHVAALPPTRSQEDEKKEIFKLPVPSTTNQVISSASTTAFSLVGKPFDLPELSGASAEVIDVSSLQTPMKRKILERVAEQEHALRLAEQAAADAVPKGEAQQMSVQEKADQCSEQEKNTLEKENKNTIQEKHVQEKTVQNAEKAVQEKENANTEQDKCLQQEKTDENTVEEKAVPERYDGVENVLPCNETITEKSYEAESSIPDSPNSNVILEGTEVELTSDEEEETNSIIVDEEPETVTLSDNEERISKPVSIPAKKNTGNGGSGGNSPPKKTDNSGGNSSKQGGSTNSTSSNSVGNTSSVSRKGNSTLRIGSSGRGDESDEDSEKKANNNKKRPLPRDYNGDDEHQDKEKQKRPQPAVMQAPPPPGMPSGHPTQPQPHCSSSQPNAQHQTPSHSSSSASSNNKQQKKTKRSPGSQGANKNRVSSKYNVTPPEKLFEQHTDDYEDVSDAYMEAYLAKVQSVTEANHPGTFANFTQLLLEYEDCETRNPKDLHAKVKVLFKDYPDLLREFESILNDTIAPLYDVTSSHEDAMAQIHLIEMVEKYTANCPALKAKIMNKMKSFKPDVTKKEMATALEPFFIGNPVMMEAFKAILPSVYRPQSLSSGMDFEEIELDMEDPPQQKGVGSDANSSSNTEDMHFEIVKLPDETQVPATSTCPCVCHRKTSDPAFASRSKHCRKCSLKFQDGKIFIHNGRVMRPVSVELTPVTK